MTSDVTASIFASKETNEQTIRTWALPLKEKIFVCKIFNRVNAIFLNGPWLEVILYCNFITVLFSNAAQATSSQKVKINNDKKHIFWDRWNCDLSFAKGHVVTSLATWY